MAFWKDLVGITTRSEVLIYSVPLWESGRSVVGGATSGAHGIIATPRGRLVAPMGTAGVFCFDGEEASRRQGWIDRPPQGVRNNYKVTYLGEWHGNEILACASRTDGLARMEISDTAPIQVLRRSAPTVDLIDVCSLRTKEHPFAVAGLSLDCSLLFVRDILDLTQEIPRRMRLEGLRGTPYSLLHAFGHLFLLTSAELVIFPDLASQFLAGEALDHPVGAYHSPVQAVEAFIAGERSLLVVTDDGVLVSEIHPAGSLGSGPVLPGGDLEVTGWTDTQNVLKSVPTEWAPLVA